MAEIDIPLVNRGAEALEALLNYDEPRARENLRLLTFSELTYLEIAARSLMGMARNARVEAWPNPGPQLQKIAAGDGEPARGGVVDNPPATEEPASAPDVCPQSQRVDGPHHSWRFDGDDPYVICAFCSEMRDALSGKTIRPARRRHDPGALIEDGDYTTGDGA